MIRIHSIARWTVGGIFFLFSFCLLVIFLFILPKPQTFTYARKLFALLIKIMGIELVVHGVEHIDPENTYLMMGNHQSLFDIFVIPAAIPLCFTGVEAAYHFSLPIWGYLVRKWGCIPIERTHLKSAIESLETAKKTIESGMNLCILPEGHRTLSGKMKAFKKGPFHLAKAAKADLLLFGISGLFDFHPKGRLILKPGKVTVNIDTPIPYQDVKSLSVEALQNLCFRRIQYLAGEIRQSE